MEYIENMMNSLNENELILSINVLIQNVISKGSLFGISKSLIIKYFREKKKLSNFWTKSVAKTFGFLLKHLNRCNVLDNLRKSNDPIPINNVRCFGLFYGNTKYNNHIFKISFSQIVCGGSHIIGLSHNNEIYSWGKNTFGQLGNGNYTKQETPTIINIHSQDRNVLKCNYVTAGFSTSSCITENGQIYSWGCTENGRSGTECGSQKKICKPSRVKHDFIATKICSGSMNQIALSDKHEIYTWGYKYYCGIETDEDIIYPTKILEDIRFYDITMGSNGGYHVMALSLSGYVYTFGHNQVGQLGFDVDNEVINNNLNEPCCQKPRLVENIKHILIKSISTGWGNSAILSYEGKAYICGRNIRGQVGIDPHICKKNEENYPYVPDFTLVDSLLHEKIDKINCGGEHLAAVTKNGSLYLWGDDSCKQLCNDVKIDKGYTYTPKLISCSSKVVNICLGPTSTFIQTEIDE